MGEEVGKKFTLPLTEAGEGHIIRRKEGIDKILTKCLELVKKITGKDARPGHGKEERHAPL